MNLSSLASVKAYLGITSTSVDANLASLLARTSEYVIRWTGRSFQRTTYLGIRLDGNGNVRMVFPDYPTISVSSLQIDSTVIPVSPDAIKAGYQFDPNILYLFGYKFNLGRRNVLLSYVTGFVNSEDLFIPATPGPYTVTPSSQGFAAVDRGVVRKSDNLAFTLVGANPSTTQYAFNAGVYTFAAADQGVLVTLTYDYVPGGVEQAVVELVGLKLKQKDNLGTQSKAIGRETITYRDVAMTDSVRDILMQYRKWIVT